jgi:hypothetical protein
MNLIDRYLHEVGRHLPTKNRQDILDELKSNLTDTLESRVQGEPTEQDVFALLKEFGPPEKVAASYYPEGQYLIGPTLFPLFRNAISITLLVVVIVHLVLIGVLTIFAGDYSAALEIVSDFFGVAFAALGVVVVVFYILQRVGFQPEKKGQEWDPSQLPDEIDEKLEIKRGETITSIVFSTIFLCVFLAFKDGIPVVSSLGTSASGSGERYLIVDPVLNQYLLAIVISLVIGIAADVYLLWRGRWTVGTRSVKIAANLVGLAVTAVLVAGHLAWLEPYTGGTLLGFLSAISELAGSNPEFVQVMVMQGVLIGLVVAFIVETVETIGLIVRMIQDFVNKPTSLHAQ